MHTIKIKLTKSLSTKEYPWLKRELIAGEEFYVYKGPTYGCISRNGIAVSEIWDTNPYFEVPKEFIVYL